MQPIEHILPETNKSVAELVSELMDELFLPQQNLSEFLYGAAQAINRIFTSVNCRIDWRANGASATGQWSRGKNDAPLKAVRLADGLQTAHVEAVPEATRKQNGGNEPDEALNSLIFPIYIAGKDMGIVRFTNIQELLPVPEEQMILGALLSRLIGQAVETQQLRQMLAAQYTNYAMQQHFAKKKKSVDDFRTQILQSVQQPEKVAKMVAKAFFKDLRRAGFEVKQILIVASEIIDNLNLLLRKTNRRAKS